MKVYVITKGIYSDYHICGVAVDEEKAKLLAERYSDSFQQANIEEFDTDMEVEKLEYANVYGCEWLKSNNSIRVHESGFDYFCVEDLEVVESFGGLFTYVLADDEQSALKIASDKFAKYRAEREGL